MSLFSTRSTGGNLTIVDPSSHESLIGYYPVSFVDDFLYTTLDATYWTAIDVSSAGDSTPVLTADGLNGLITLPTDNTSEAQEAGLTWGDQRVLAPARGLVFECRLAATVLPTTGVAAVWGLAADKNATADSVTVHLWFRLQASGALLVESDDTATDNDDKSAGITLVAAEYHVFRIDCTNTSDVRFYVDGAAVATSTTFTLAGATPATLGLQPYFHIGKASGTGVGTLGLDYVKCFQNRA